MCVKITNKINEYSLHIIRDFPNDCLGNAKLGILDDEACRRTLVETLVATKMSFNTCLPHLGSNSQLSAWLLLNIHIFHLKSGLVEAGPVATAMMIGSCIVCLHLLTCVHVHVCTTPLPQNPLLIEA